VSCHVQENYAPRADHRPVAGHAAVFEVFEETSSAVPVPVEDADLDRGLVVAQGVEIPFGELEVRFVVRGPTVLWRRLQLEQSGRHDQRVLGAAGVGSTQGESDRCERRGGHRRILDGHVDPRDRASSAPRGQVPVRLKITVSAASLAT
jgi:hypothetical protein